MRARIVNPVTAAILSCLVTAVSARAEAPPSAAPSVAMPVLRRLTRTEFGNSMRDLLGIDAPFGADLPADVQTSGFDVIGDSLSLTPVLLERYLKIARRASDLAIGRGNASPVTEAFSATNTQSEWQEGMPPGTRGGVLVKHYFPRDGEYELRAFLKGMRDLPLPPTEGVRFFHTKIPISGGEHTFIATFPAEYTEREGSVPNLEGPGGLGPGGPVDIRGSTALPTLEFWLDGKRVQAFEIHAGNAGEVSTWTWPGPPTLGRTEITGPINAGRAAPTALQDQIHACQKQGSVAQRTCASKILRPLARRAYRREVTDADMEQILAAYARARKAMDFDEAVGMGLRSILVSPDFLFRVERDPSFVKVGQRYRISDYELATRLSYFLWSSLPDDELLNLAKRNRLRDTVDVKREVHRMLSDARADALVDNFAFQWLGLHDIKDARPDPATFPEFDDGLRQAFEEETRLFMRSIVRENRSVMDVVIGDYTFLNDRLAKLYGISGVQGPAFRRVALIGNEQRGGVLTQGSVLMVTSHAATTSPILRGKWVLTNLFASPPPTPPPGVPPLDMKPTPDGHKLSTREQIERHRTSPVCASCHVKMDPYGFALENYDVIGKWRTQDNGNPVDATGEIRGNKFNGPGGLKGLLVAHSDEFVAATVSRLMTYALGRQLEASDQSAIHQVASDAKAGNYHFADLVIGIVESEPFQMRQGKVSVPVQIQVARGQIPEVKEKQP
jgi:Protein of unknown function (DUF1592)/Protein of unknown function (DUF1588)/Protein of unknown function (DUF1585)/Protein of unknown function (DUF1587)/Protein of unknown function (DUF1595)